jgi:hypothetical protein
LRSGHHEKDLRYIKHKENKMPRANKTAMKKSTSRKTAPRRKASERRDTYSNGVGNFRGSEDIFWTKVVNGLEKFLESPF